MKIFLDVSLCVCLSMYACFKIKSYALTVNMHHQVLFIEVFICDNAECIKITVNDSVYILYIPVHV